MEKGGPVFESWARGEAAFARSTLEGIPGRAELYQRIASLDKPGGGVTDLQVRRDRWLYQRLTDEGDKRKLFVRTGYTGPEHALDLLAALPAEAGPWSEVAAARVLSPDGRYLTFGTTQKGEANPTLRVFDLQEFRLLPDIIDWPLWADSDGFRPRWLSDSSGFLYVRRPDANASMDNTARARGGQVFLHRLGTLRSADRALFGHGLTPEIMETDTLYVQGEPHLRWLSMLRRMPGGGREIWVLDLTQLGQAGLPPARRIFASDVLARGYGVLGDFLYTVDPEDAPRFALVRFDLRQREPQREVALSQQEGVLASMVVAADGVYVAENLLSRSRLHVIGPSEPRVMTLEGGIVDVLQAGPEGRGAWVEQVDWTAPRHGGVLEAGANKLREPQVAGPPRSGSRKSGSRVEWATARDGERIPYTIV